jgi:hypothetical protein
MVMKIEGDSRETNIAGQQLVFFRMSATWYGGQPGRIKILVPKLNLGTRINQH